MQEENFTAISDLDTSNITNMGSMFAYASSYNQDISQWDTSKVESMGDMFSYASDFNQDISKWNTSNVTNMNAMFYMASSFNSDISEWETGNVKDISFMFTGASRFTRDISEWDTSKVTDMSDMFRQASSFNSDISKWDTSNVTNMGYMFQSAASFNSDISQWCVSLIKTRPSGFDTSSGFAGQTARQPDWGKCPRGEDGKPTITLPEMPDPEVSPEVPEVSPASAYTIIKLKDGVAKNALVYAPYDGTEFRYSCNDDADGNPIWEDNATMNRLYVREPRREGNLVYLQSREEGPDKGFKFYHNGFEDWVEDIIAIENDEVVTLAHFGVYWGRDQEEPKYMTCLERPITITGKNQDPETGLSFDFGFQSSHIDQGLETFLYNYKDAKTWKIAFLFGNSIYNQDVSKWMKGTTYACGGLQPKHEYNFDLTGIENRCLNDSFHQDFKQTPYDYRPHIREYSKGIGAPDAPYEPIGVFHKYVTSSNSLEQGESYISSYIKLADTDEEGVDTSEAIALGDSVATVTDYGEQLFFYKCTTIKNLTQGKQYSFEKILSNRTSTSSSSKQYKFYVYREADVNAQYTTSVEKITGRWINENQFELQATVKNQSSENISVESNDGDVLQEIINPTKTTKITKVFENPEASTTVSVHAKSTNTQNTLEKDIELKVVKYTTPSENSFVNQNTGSYTSTLGGGKISKASSYITYYANKTDVNGKVFGEEPSVGEHVICNGKEVKISKVNLYASYYYLKLELIDGNDSEWLATFSDNYNGEDNWIEFL